MKSVKPALKYHPFETTYYECRCESAEHVLRFIYDPDENDLYTEVKLVQYRNIFQRIWVAIKYICGYKCRYGNWDCTLIKPEDCKGIKMLLDKVIKNTIGKTANNIGAYGQNASHFVLLGTPKGPSPASSVPMLAVFPVALNFLKGNLWLITKKSSHGEA